MSQLEHCRSCIGSGDSWEHDFDDNDLSTLKDDTIPMMISSTNVTEQQDVLSSVVDIVSNESIEIKKPNESDDDWESWN
jgi:hypothetical protein